MKRLRHDAIDIIAGHIKKKNQDLEVFLGNHTKPLNECDPQELAKMGLEWGLMSQKGHVCGILGCNTEPNISCAICGGHYCDDHKNWHHHRADNDGIIEKDSNEL